MAVSAFAQDAETTTAAVTASFMGASGKMRLVQTETGDFLEVKQAKLQEVDANGKKVGGPGKSLNVAGKNSWTPLAEDNGAFSTTFSTSEKGVDFSLTAYLGSQTTSVTAEVACSDCKTGIGECRMDGGARRGILCEAIGDDGVCSTGYTPCVQTSELKKDELKFSFTVSGWAFSNPTNRLEYGLTLTSSAGAGTLSDSLAGKTLSVGGGFLSTPTTAFYSGGDADRTVDVQITSATVDGASELTFSFPSTASVAESIFYDPTLGFTEETQKAEAAAAGAAGAGAGAGAAGSEPAVVPMNGAGYMLPSLTAVAGLVTGVLALL